MEMAGGVLLYTNSLTSLPLLCRRPLLRHHILYDEPYTKVSKRQIFLSRIFINYGTFYKNKTYINSKLFITLALLI